MEFQFESLSQMFWMEGHGPYVWAAYLITLFGICGLALNFMRARKNFFRFQASILKRKQQTTQQVAPQITK